MVSGVLLGSLIFLLNSSEKRQNECNGEDFSFFREKRIIENPKSDVGRYFNNLLMYQKMLDEVVIDDISLGEVKNLDENLENLQEIKNTLEEKEQNSKNDLESLIKNYSIEKQKEIRRIYRASDIGKNKEKNKEKYNEILKKIEKQEEFLNYLKKNEKFYEIQDEKIVCLTEEVASNILKYNENIKVALKEVNFPILMYHGVLDNPSGGKELFVRVSDFDKQMKYLKDEGYTPLYLSEIASANNFAKPVIITFDDGYSDVYQNAYPILKKYNLKGNLYVITDWVGGPVYVNWDMVKEMDKSDFMEIGSHTATHRNLASLSAEKMDMEMKKSKETLEEKLERSVDTIAYPYGGYNNQTLEIAKKYYKYALSTNEGKENSKNLNLLSLNRYYIYRDMTFDTFKKIVN